MITDYKYAVLIDADNTSGDYLKTVFDIITNEGTVTYRRIYGDWTDERLKSYKELIFKFSLSPMQQFNYTKGKNATDSFMIIDAMDILYKGNVDGFCIVSSDSDFTKLASRLIESGKKVIGMGRHQTPKAFVEACTEFKYLDLIEEGKAPEKEGKNGVGRQSESETKASVTLSPKMLTLKKDISKIIDENSDASGWILASQLGELMVKKHNDFDPKHYGCKKLATLLEELDFEIKKERNPNNIANPNGLEVFVKIKE